MGTGAMAPERAGTLDAPELPLSQINLKRLIHAEVKDALRKVIAKQKSPGNTLMRDKLTFAVVSVDLYFTAYWLGSWCVRVYSLDEGGGGGRVRRWGVRGKVPLRTEGSHPMKLAQLPANAYCCST